MMARFRYRLNEQVSNAPLVIFRIIFGALMLFGALRVLSKGWVETLYIQPDFHFTYLGFDWVHPLPGNWMYLPFILMIFGSLGMILGLFYRASASLFFLCFTYVELIDKTYYLNHYYFVSLVAFWMIFLPANRRFSLDVLRNPALSTRTTRKATIAIIQFQLGIVYFFAGIAKLESDWLWNAQPLHIWLQGHRDLPVVGSFFAQKWTAFAFSWFGCIYDLTIPFFLLQGKTRPFAYVFVVGFHLITWWLFPIGVFPWVMIFSTLIFFSGAFHEKILGWMERKLPRWSQDPRENSIQRTHPIFQCLIGMYLVAQLLLPFRYILYPTSVFWTEEGFRFSWRVMLMHKEGTAVFYVKDRKTGGEIEINNQQFLTDAQIDQMATQPDFILQFAHHLRAIYSDTTLVYGQHQVRLTNPAVHASVFVSLNGRESRKFVDKKHDLTQIEYSLAPRTWIERF